MAVGDVRARPCDGVTTRCPMAFASILRQCLPFTDTGGDDGMNAWRGCQPGAWNTRLAGTATSLRLRVRHAYYEE
jgi:hypothetical protein